jgi:cytochrome c553
MARLENIDGIAAMYRRAAFIVLTACTLLGIQGTPAAAGNPDAGRVKAVMCKGCHTGEGMRINRPEIYRIPKISGQHAAYLESALRAYRAGERQNENMHAVTVSLSDQDIQDLAAYFAGQRWSNNN